MSSNYYYTVSDEAEELRAEVARLRGRADYAEKTIYRLVSTTDLRNAPSYLKRALGEIVRKHDDDPLDAR